MNAPAQKDLFTKRHSKVPRLDPLEYKMQIWLVDLLNRVLRDGRVAFWHTPNGEWRDIKTAAKLKAMGVLPGVADLHFTWGEMVSVVGEPGVQIFSRDLYVELKRRGLKLSPEQEQFRDSVTAKGSYYEVADSIDEAVEILKRYGVLKNTK